MKIELSAILFLCLAGTAAVVGEMSPALKDLRENFYQLTGVPGILDKLDHTLSLNWITNTFLSKDIVRGPVYGLMDTGVVALITAVEPYLRQATDFLETTLKNLVGGIPSVSTLFSEFFLDLDYAKTTLAKPS